MRTRRLASSNPEIIQTVEALIRQGEFVEACEEIAFQLSDPIYDTRYDPVRRLGELLRASRGDLNEMVDIVMHRARTTWEWGTHFGNDIMRQDAAERVAWLLRVLPEDAPRREDIERIMGWITDSLNVKNVT